MHRKIKLLPLASGNLSLLPVIRIGCASVIPRAEVPVIQSTRLGTEVRLSLGEEMSVSLLRTGATCPGRQPH